MSPRASGITAVVPLILVGVAGCGWISTSDAGTSSVAPVTVTVTATDATERSTTSEQIPIPPAQSRSTDEDIASRATLGKVWAPNQTGYGEVEPSTIFNGGDASGSVSDVTWTSWGQPRAEGTGTSLYVAPGDSMASARPEQALVVAFKLGVCDGQLMYQAIQWYFPLHGETFNPNRYIDICTGEYVGTG